MVPLGYSPLHSPVPSQSQAFTFPSLPQSPAMSHAGSLIPLPSAAPTPITSRSSGHPAQGPAAAAAAAAPAPALMPVPGPIGRMPRERHTRADSVSTSAPGGAGPPRPTLEGTQPFLERIVGEVAFQLDRRILSSIFPDRVRLYGFTVGNIPDKIMQSGNDLLCPVTEEQRKGMMERYEDIMNRLKPKGYDANYHPQLTEYIVNTFGILRERPDTTKTGGDFYNDVSYLQEVVENVVPVDKRADCLVLLRCLQMLSQADGKPLFIW
nr:speriolin [Anolis sagrei ordinatus]